MGLDVNLIGRKGPAASTVIDPGAARAYAEATNDPNPAYVSGELAPPVFIVVPTMEALSALALQVIPQENLLMVVHGEQDIVYHQPLRTGATLITEPEVYAIKVARSGTRLIIRLASVDPDGQPVVDIYNTVFIRGLVDGDSAGGDKPEHGFPEEARDRHVGRFSVHVDDDQTFRYSKAANDPMPIHLDADVARKAGLPGIIAHGLCTMAMCSRAVIQMAADGDPTRLRRLAVRFSKPVIPGNDVLTNLYDVSPGVFAFEAESAGEAVIKDGRAEISD